MKKGKSAAKRAAPPAILDVPPPKKITFSFSLLNQEALQAPNSSTPNAASSIQPKPFEPLSFPKKKKASSVFNNPAFPSIPPGPSAASTSKLMKYACRNPYFNIVVIPNGHPYLFFGWCSVICYSGTVRIDGYDLEANSFSGDPGSMFSVCAPACDGRPALFESRTLETQKANSKEKRLRLRLKEVTEEFDRIVDEWKDEGVSILMIHRKVPIAVDLFSQIHEDKLFLPQGNIFIERNDLVESPGWKIYNPESWESVDRGIEHIKQKSANGLKCTVLPYGSKGSGKSTFMRVLINRLLSIQQPVYLLDVDLGQAEFTLAGCLSLRKIEKPVLDVPWCHQNVEMVHTYFYGDVSPANDMDKYKNIFIRLLNTFKEKSEPGSILIINTMGWVEGAGLDALQYMIYSCDPNCVFQINGREKLPSLILPDGCQLYQIHRDFPLKGSGNLFKNYYPRSLRPIEYRELRTIGYFSHFMTKPFFANILQGRMFKINFRDAIFGVPEDLANVDDHYFLATLNVQLVAFCSAEEDVAYRRILERDYLPQMFIIDAVTPLLRCHGFGIINAIDMDKQQFHVISPISPEDMVNVTIMARGRNMTVPAAISRTTNGQPAMYRMDPLDDNGGVDPDLYSALRTEHQGKFKRHFFPTET